MRFNLVKLGAVFAGCLACVGCNADDPKDTYVCKTNGVSVSMQEFLELPNETINELGTSQSVKLFYLTDILGYSDMTNAVSVARDHFCVELKRAVEEHKANETKQDN